MKFHSFGLDLNPMTLVLILYLDIVKICVCTENEVPRFNISKVEQVHRLTDLTVILTNPHTRMGIRIPNVSSAHLISPLSNFPGKVTGDVVVF